MRRSVKSPPAPRRRPQDTVAGAPRTAPAARSAAALVPLLLIGAAAVLAYAPALRGPFFWDDAGWIRDNLTLRSLAGLWQIWFEPQAVPQYVPLVFTSFWLERLCFGPNPLPMHIVNLALHLANSALLLIILRRLQVPGALLAAALFALHPVHVESVAWITERKDILSAFFSLLCVLAWVRWLERGEWRAYAWTLLGFTAAMLSKSIASTLPLSLLLLTWWHAPQRLRRALPLLLPLLLIGAGIGLVVRWREQTGYTVIALSLAERVLLVGRSLWFYAATLVWPVRLSRIYPRWTLDQAAAWQYAFTVAAVAVLMALWALRRRIGRGPLVAVAFFAVTLAPVSGLVPYAYFTATFVADHSQYLASAGLIALAAALWAHLFPLLTKEGARGRPNGAGPVSRWIAVAVPVAVLVISGALTWQQARLYADDEAQWRDAAAKAPDSFAAHEQLGLALAARGKFAEAVEQFHVCTRLKLDYRPAYVNCGTALDRLGRTDEAAAEFQAALDIDPRDAMANHNLGAILAARGRTDEAIAHFRAAVERMPEYASAHFNWGLLLERQGKLDEAIAQYQQALRYEPRLAQAREHLQRAQAARAGAQSNRPWPLLGKEGDPMAEGPLHSSGTGDPA